MARRSISRICAAVTAGTVGTARAGKAARGSCGMLSFQHGRQERSTVRQEPEGYARYTDRDRMPIVIRHHTSCRAPAAVAWSALVDITRWPQWYPHVQKVTHLSGPDAGRLRAGSVWEERVRRGPFTPQIGRAHV